MIDTHTHLYLPEFTEETAQGGFLAVKRALDAGVERMIFPNVDLTTVAPMRALHDECPEVTSMAMGLHPTEIKETWRDDLARILELIGSGDDYVAVGEIGIDLYWDRTFEREQMLAFEAQVNCAVELGLPVIVHCREGLAQTLEVLQAFPSARGVMHSFGGTPDDVDAVRKVVDFYFGINGIVTFRNSRLRDTLPAIGQSRLLLETDSPYLAPVPFRGKRNESAYLPYICGHMAQSLAVSSGEMDKVTTENALTLFGFVAT